MNINDYQERIRVTMNKVIAGKEGFNYFVNQITEYSNKYCTTEEATTPDEFISSIRSEYFDKSQAKQKADMDTQTAKSRLRENRRLKNLELMAGDEE